jgi:endonuclease/exonuclease/phosphatase family metal-dependent hydrolase
MTTIQRAEPNNRHTPSSQNQPPARLAQRLRRWAQRLVALALFSAGWAQTAPALGGSNGGFTPPGARDVTILDQNLYVGTEFTPILALDPTDTNYVRNLLMAVAEVYQGIVASDFPTRAQALARQIAATQPDLVALQEVSVIRTQVPGDLLLGGTTPASDVQLDYLAILLANLNRHGAHYAAVAIVTNLDMELPMPTGTPGVFADVRLTDHDVILARVGLPPGQLRVSHPQAGNFQTALPLPGLGSSIPRGWCSVDVTTRGRTFRFINAHLEENTAAPIQAAQAQELLVGPANTSLPVILVGDFNSDANGNDGTTTYGMLTQSLTDTWNVVHPRNPGFTWGHDPLLADPSLAFVWRLDLVLFRGSQFQPLDMWRFSPQFQTTPPLWPSDHAGVVARLRIK